MSKNKEILRLHYVSSLSHRSIAASLEVSRSTVTNVLRRAEAAELSWPLPTNLQDEEQLEHLLYPAAIGRPRKIAEPDWNHIFRNYTEKASRCNSCGLSIGRKIRMDTSTANSVSAIESGRRNWMSPCTSTTVVAKSCSWTTLDQLFK